MPLFSVTEISPEIRSHRTTLEHNWNLAMNSLDAPARARYLESLRQPRDPGRELLFLYCLHCGAIQGEIFYRGTVYFFMGIPLQADRFPDIVPLRSTQGELRCELWVHRASLEIVQPIFQNEIVPLSRELLLLDTSIPGRNWIDYLQILESFLSQKALKVIKRGMPITFSHFRFHNLNHYFELLGEAGANEMIQHIEDNIKERLKSQDLSLTLSPHSYLVVSIGMTEEQIYPRFQTLYFEVKSLILDYELLVQTIRTEDFSMFDLFRDLKI